MGSLEQKMSLQCLYGLDREVLHTSLPPASVVQCGSRWGHISSNHQHPCREWEGCQNTTGEHHRTQLHARNRLLENCEMKWNGIVMCDLKWNLSYLMELDWLCNGRPCRTYLPSFKRCVVDGLVQERRNSSALAVELCVSCTIPSNYDLHWLDAP